MKPSGCESVPQSVTRSQLATFEIFVIADEVRQMINKLTGDVYTPAKGREVGWGPCAKTGAQGSGRPHFLPKK